MSQSTTDNSIQLLSFDIDNTLIDLRSLKGNFSAIWEKYKDQHSTLLTYNTGRLYKDVLSLIKKGILPEPHFIISGVGTHIYDYQQGAVLKEFNEILDEGWNLELVEKTVASLPFPIEIQPRKYQHSYKRSYFFHNAEPRELRQAEQAFNAAGLNINLVYSGNKYFDVLPKWANKGNALQWLLKHLDLKTTQALVAGDSGNDAAMFELEGIRGIAVSNAREELYHVTKYLQVYHSEHPKDTGVVEGLVFYKVLPEEAIEVVQTLAPVPEAHFLRQQTDHPIHRQDTKYELILEGYHQAVAALKKNISPLGFLACPIEYNEAEGTDENYHSVWARDGAITVIGSLSLVNDPEIHQCQRQTLITLLDNISINGQIPANVRLSDQSPDYSGVGGICSIDSGLWVIIAFHDYVRATSDIDFLKEHITDLQRAMNWLSAHDSNNDALLEIPEAGDWTDLFGRSYHVLYDEVLWYRANVCFGRLLEILGDHSKAGDYMRWSQVIRKEIVTNFWPSTQQETKQRFDFADQQYSLGDTKYLLAQITPFDFSWRCDSYGNILAYLYNVIDPEKAHKSLRFMLGVGMNDPFPIRNVYPEVSPGDPDWRAYYTVNLLNLPNHYHNGGIWPFIGAFWVQFIEKLGQHEMAMSELYKLALINKAGISSDWEFTEWAHGKTGNPMGKVYQAWSAAQYIAACHQLKIV